MRDMLWFKNRSPAFRSILASQPWRWEYEWMRQSLEHEARVQVADHGDKVGLGEPGGKFFGGFRMRCTDCCLPHPFVRLGLELFKIMA